MIHILKRLASSSTMNDAFMHPSRRPFSGKPCYDVHSWKDPRVALVLWPHHLLQRDC